jgi:HSP20 family protein
MSVRDLTPWGRNNGSQVPNLLRDDDREPQHEACFRYSGHQ